MVIIYEAANIIEANLIKGLLQQEAIEAHVGGEFLAGGAGELPVFGLVNVMVEEDDVAAANKVIEAYESGAYALGDDA